MRKYFLCLHEEVVGVDGQLKMLSGRVILILIVAFSLYAEGAMPPKYGGATVIYNVSASVNLHNGIAPEPFPVVVGDLLYFVDNTENTNLTAMDYATGKTKWIKGPIYFGYTTRLVVVQGQLYAQVRGDDDFTLQRIDAKTGDMITVFRGYQGYCKPFAVNDVLYLSDFDDDEDSYAYFALNVTSMMVMWKAIVCPIDEPHRYLPAPCALALVDDTLFLQQQGDLCANTTYFGLSTKAQQVVWKKVLSMPSITSAYKPEQLGIHGGRLVVRWNYDSKIYGFAPDGETWEVYYDCHGNWYCGETFVADGVLLHYASSSGPWEAIDVASGKPLWRSTSLQIPFFEIDRLWLFRSKEGKVFVNLFAMHPRTRKVLWNVSLPMVNGFNVPYAATDAAGSVIYLRYDKVLYALTASSGSIEWQVASQIDSDEQSTVISTPKGIVILTDENYIVGIKDGS